MKKSDNEIWVFLSHSNKDYEKVKSVRDKLERDDFRPIMFFLKSLEDDVEINDLIKREIDARTWFILCDSKNAQSSTWVQKEVEYIKSKKRRCVVVDLNSSEEAIDEVLRHFSFRSNVFISYSSKDLEVAEKIETALINEDYRVFGMPNNYKAGSDFASQRDESIEIAAKKGCVVAIISDNHECSEWQMNEINLAISKNAMIIPFKVKDVTDIDFEIGKLITTLNRIDEHTEDEIKYSYSAKKTRPYIYREKYDYDVYLSYDRKDRHVVEALACHLESVGIKCFIYSKDMVYSDIEIVASSIMNSSIVVSILSNSYIESDFTTKELAISSNWGKPIIVYKIEDCNLLLGDKIFYFTHKQCIDSSDNPTRCFDLLVNGIKQILNI